MAIRRDQAADAPPLSSGVIATVLSGWGSWPPKDVPEDQTGLFELYVEREAGIVRVWREHESFLRATAAAWGVAPSYELADGRRLFFAEFCCLREQVLGESRPAPNAAAADAQNADDEEEAER